jgi:hypothetical protein
MKHKGPIITLFAGLLVAGVLFVMNVNVNKDAAKDAAARNAGANATATTSAPGKSPGAEATKPEAPPPAPSSAAPPAEGKSTYAGAVDGGAAGLAIAINAGRLVAYVCDGRNTEAWLDGTVSGGQIDVKGPKGTLVATYGNGVATGTVTAGSKKWHFTIKLAVPPSGLYRSAANVRNRLDASWAQTPDGQFGTKLVNGNLEPAPPLDTNTNTATVDGTPVPVEPVNP